MSDHKRGCPGREYVCTCSHDEAGGWQPIETAPKDGTDVDLWVNGERAVDFHMDNHGRWARVEGYPTYTRILTARPTHWMRPPEPPND